MKAIILAAGRGNRMKEFTKGRPKCLVKLNGIPLIEWQLNALQKAGVHEIAIVTGYKRETLSDYGLVEFHNSRWATSNMVTSLTCAGEWLRKTPCIVSYSDIFYQASVIKSLMASPADLAISYDPDWKKLWEARFGDPLLDAETFRLNGDGTVREIGGRPCSAEEIEGQYMGLLKFTPSGWASICTYQLRTNTNQWDALDMTSLLGTIIKQKYLTIHAIPNNAFWGEVDTQQDLELYESQYS